MEKKRKNEEMPSKRYQTKAYKPKRPFCTVEGVGSNAWKRLSRNGVFVLMKFYEKYNGYNRYELSLTYREIKSKMSNTLFSRSIWELVGYGFIDVKRSGRLEKICSIYGLSHRWRKLNSQPEKLDQIQNHLLEIEELKRQPGSTNKRMKMYKLRNKVLKLGTGR